jgi:LysM repeat protein
LQHFEAFFHRAGRIYRKQKRAIARFLQHIEIFSHDLGGICRKQKRAIVRSLQHIEIFSHNLGGICWEQKRAIVRSLQHIEIFSHDLGGIYREQKRAIVRSLRHSEVFSHNLDRICREQKQAIVRSFQHSEVFSFNLGRVCWEQKLAIARLLLILCLYQALFFGSPLFSGLAPLTKGRISVSGTIQTGVGGGSYFNADLVKGQLGEEMSLEDGVREPEAFSKPQILLYTSYSIQKDDMIGTLATNFGLEEDTLISINNIRNARLIQIGHVLRIPNQDGIMYSVKNGDTLEKIAEKYKSDAKTIRFANELFSDTIKPGSVLFVPGAQLDWMERQEINGDLFIWPAAGYITSPYGNRNSPFGGGSSRQFHSGIDIGAPMGAPVRAAMSGRVSAVGWDDVLGNYAVVSHHSGYRSMYGHMSAVRVKSGAYVGTGERIGDVGSTGQSTGPHVHFTVYKNGVTVNPRSLMK